jgi:hypothetical protein
MKSKLPIEIAEYCKAMFAALDEWDSDPRALPHHYSDGEARVFVHAFLDGYLNRAYADGFGEPHELTVCVPIEGPAERRAYRLGYLAGQAARTPLN